MTKVKMCGLRREVDIENANKLLPDYIGYVFAPKSKRYITPAAAAGFTKNLDSRITPVGVFVNEDISKVIEIADSGAIKIVQLHGSEDEDYIAKLRANGITVIKAFIVKSALDIKLANESSADYVLLDAGMGDGKQFDYKLLNAMKRPYFLAGGLDPQNVGEAVEALSPYAVDVSSGIETDSFKDFDKMKNFMKTINRKDR